MTDTTGNEGKRCNSKDCGDNKHCDAFTAVCVCNDSFYPVGDKECWNVRTVELFIKFNILFSDFFLNFVNYGISA